MGWLNKVSDSAYIMNGNTPGKLKALTEAKCNAFKKAISKLRMQAVSIELQNFIYFGGEGFQGLKHWANFGEDKEDGWLFKLEDIGQSMLMSVQEGKSLEKIIFTPKLSALHKTSIHIEVIFDASVTHIENDLNAKLADLEAVVEEKNYDYLQTEMLRIVFETQKKLSETDGKHSEEETFSERNKIFTQ